MSEENHSGVGGFLLGALFFAAVSAVASGLVALIGVIVIVVCLSAAGDG